MKLLKYSGENEEQERQDWDSDLELIPLETNLPDLEDEFEISTEKNVGTVENFVSGEITTEYVQDFVEIEGATEKLEINISDDLNKLINEINQQSTSQEKDQNEGDELNCPIALPSSVKSFIEEELDEVFKDALNLNIRNTPAENPSTTNKPKLQRKQRPRKVSQPKQKATKIKIIYNAWNKFSYWKVTTYSPTIKQNIEVRTEAIVGPQILENSGYELYTEQNVQSSTTPPPELFNLWCTKNKQELLKKGTYLID